MSSKFKLCTRGNARISSIFGDNQIIYNGNHSTLSGILKGEGTIQANQTYDLVPTYDYMYFDGIYFRNKMNDEKLYKVARFEIGALYEIGRILAENGIR